MKTVLLAVFALVPRAWADCPEAFHEWCGDIEWCQGPDKRKAVEYCKAVNTCHAVHHPGYHASCDQLTAAEEGVEKAKESLERAKEEFVETPSDDARNKLDQSVSGHHEAVDALTAAYGEHYNATKALEDSILNVDGRYPECLDPGDCSAGGGPAKARAAAAQAKLEQEKANKKQEGDKALQAAKAAQAKAEQAAQAYKTLLASQKAGPDAQKSARQFIDGALKENPNNPSALRVRAIDAYQRGDCSAVAASAQAILTRNPADKQIAQMASLCKSGAPLSAALVKPGFDKTPGPGPGDSGGAVRLGGSMKIPEVGAAPAGLPPAAQSAYFASQAAQALMMRDFGRALAYAARSSDINPANIDAWRLRAMAGGHLKDYRKAIEDASEGLKLYPRDKQLLNIKSYSQNKAKDYKGALETADAALAVDALDAAAWMNRAYALAGLGNRQGMLEALRKAAALDPRFRGALEAAEKLPEAEDAISLFLDGAVRKAPTPARGGIPRAWLLAGLAAGCLLTLAGFYGLTRRSEPETPAD